MSKLTDDLRRIGVLNDHGFCYESGAVNANRCVRPKPPVIEGIPEVVPFVAYTPAEPGRGYRSAHWQVIRGKYITDKDAHWRDNGKKTFSMYRREEKAKQLEAALAWASDRYNITEWAKTPFGSYAPAAFVKARLAQLRELTKTLPPAEMKVWYWRSSRGGYGQVKMLCAANSKAAAVRAAGETSTADASETGNAEDMALARAYPGIVLFHPMREVGKAVWRRLDTDEPVS